MEKSISFFVLCFIIFVSNQFISGSASPISICENPINPFCTSNPTGNISFSVVVESSNGIVPMDFSVSNRSLKEGFCNLQNQTQFQVLLENAILGVHEFISDEVFKVLFCEPVNSSRVILEEVVQSTSSGDLSFSIWVLVSLVLMSFLAAGVKKLLEDATRWNAARRQQLWKLVLVQEQAVIGVGWIHSFLVDGHVLGLLDRAQEAAMEASIVGAFDEAQIFFSEAEEAYEIPIGANIEDIQSVEWVVASDAVYDLRMPHIRAVQVVLPDLPIV